MWPYMCRMHVSMSRVGYLCSGVVCIVCFPVFCFSMIDEDKCYVKIINSREYLIPLWQPIHTYRTEKG